MTIVEIVNNKNFMNMLFRSYIFDNFEVREVSIKTFINFEINCTLNKEYYSLTEQENIKNQYCLWKDLKPVVFQIIKGNRQPKFIKFIFSLDEVKTQQFDSQAKALFLNVTFDSGKILCVSGCSQKNFSLDKKLEIKWDEYIKEFFYINNINL